MYMLATPSSVSAWPGLLVNPDDPGSMRASIEPDNETVKLGHMEIANK